MHFLSCSMHVHLPQRPTQYVMQQKKHTICRFILHSVNKNYTSTTFCCLNQRRLEKCRWPGSGYETVGVPNHRKHHGWSRMYINKFLFLLFFIFFYFRFACIDFLSDFIPQDVHISHILKVQTILISSTYIVKECCLRHNETYVRNISIWLT